MDLFRKTQGRLELIDLSYVLQGEC